MILFKDTFRKLENGIKPMRPYVFLVSLDFISGVDLCWLVGCVSQFGFPTAVVVLEGGGMDDGIWVCLRRRLERNSNKKK